MTPDDPSTIIDATSPELAATLAVLGARRARRKRTTPRRTAEPPPDRREPDTAPPPATVPLPTPIEERTTVVDPAVDAEFEEARKVVERIKRERRRVV